MDLPLFVSAGELEEFEKPERVVSRSIFPADSPATVAMPLENEIALEAARVIRSDSATHSCLTIAVHDRDGMTWSAELAARALRAQFAENFTVYSITNTSDADRIPAIATLLTETNLLSTAAKFKLTVSFLHLRSPQALVYAAMAVGAAGGMMLLKSLYDAADKGTTSEIGVAQILLAGVLALLGLLGNWLKGPLESRTRENSRDQFHERISAAYNSNAYKTFVDALAEQLSAGPFPRAVVVDNFQRLDPTSRDVITRYFERFATSAIGSELWIVFEPRDATESLALERRKHPSAAGYLQTKAYDLKLLTQPEKSQLRKFLGRPEAAEDFATVAAVCADPLEGDERTLTLLKEYKAHLPPPIGGLSPFRVLYLLALGSGQGGLFLPETEILSTWVKASKTRSTVLWKFLGVNRLERNELRSALKSVREHFRGVLLEQDGADGPQIRVRPEVEPVISREAVALDLPSADLGHLYWALWWHDRGSSQPLSVVASKKLSFHLLRSSAATLDDADVYRSLQSHLVDVALYAINTSMRSGLLRHVSDLIQHVRGLFGGEPRPSQTGHRPRLLKACWDAYALLGEPSILDAIQDIREPLHLATPAGQDADPLMRLERFFVDGLVLSGDARTSLAVDLFPRPGQSSPTREAIADYARLQAAWVGLSMSRVVVPLPGGSLAEIMKAANDGIVDATKSAAAHATGREDRGLTALLAVTVGVWCHALRVGEFDRLPAALLTVAAEPIRAAVSDAIDVCETAVLLASDLRSASRKLVGANAGDLPRQALVHEICAVTLGALVVVGRRLSRTPAATGPDTDTAIVAKVQATVKLAADILEMPLPSIEWADDLTGSQLQDALANLWKLHGVIWQRFGLDRLGALVDLRHLQYELLRAPVELDDDPRLDGLARAVLTSAREGDLTMLATDVSLAWAFQRTDELEGYYIIQAARTALTAAFDADLRCEMCWHAVQAGGSKQDLAPFLEVLLADSSQPRPAERILRSLPEGGLVGAALRLLNADSNEPARACVRAAGDAGSVDVRREIEALLEAISWSDPKSFTAAGLPSTEEAIASWADRKDQWLYPWFLEQLWRHRGLSPRVKEEVQHVLDRNALADRFNSYLLLAIHAAAQIDDPQDPANEVACRYLETALPKWSTDLAVEPMVQGYTLLYRRATDRKLEYQSHLIEWEKKRLKRDHVRRLRQLVAEGRFFLVFLHYFESMVGWDVPAEPPARQIVNRLRANAATPAADVGDPILAAVLKRGGRFVVNGEFLLAGAPLFESPQDANPALKELRDRYNAEARRRLSTLLDLVFELPELPPQVKELLRWYSDDLLKAA